MSKHYHYNNYVPHKNFPDDNEPFLDSFGWVIAVLVGGIIYMALIGKDLKRDNTQQLKIQQQRQMRQKEQINNLPKFLDFMLDERYKKMRDEKTR